MRLRHKLLLILPSLLVMIVAVLLLHGVSQDITSADKSAIDTIMGNNGYDYETLAKNADTFENQIIFIRAVQDAIFKQTLVQKRIAYGSFREPAALLSLDYAQCGDRSRFMEKAFRLAGFDVRYASLYANGRSHALIEVKTAKGWMLVDSVQPWIGLPPNEHVVNLDNWNAYKNAIWQYDMPYPLLYQDFIKIYGLYSRHGQYYPPFTPYIPDIDWRMFLVENI